MLDNNMIQLEHVLFAEKCTFTLHIHANHQNCFYDNFKYHKKFDGWARIVVMSSTLGDGLIFPISYLWEILDPQLHD